MELDPAIAYRALLSRDARFDGRFFVGVSTTGIYCRPICRVRAPKASSCSFFATAAAAEQRGFRPCLRCRPELAPGLAQMDSPAVLAVAAARLIDASGGAAAMTRIAAQVGVTERHLRRVFSEHFGLAPIEYAQTRRLLLAKQLLTETALPVVDVALLAGFGSLRRMNALFRERYRFTPGALRRKDVVMHAEGDLVLNLDYRPPLDYASLLRFFAGRAVPGVEMIEAQTYRRTVLIEAVETGACHSGWLEVTPGGGDRLRLRFSAGLRPVLAPLLAAVRRQFDLDADPQQVAMALGALASPRPGLRLPGAIHGFEQAVRAVLGQQVSVAAATTLAGRIASTHGSPVATPFAQLNRLFPDAACMAELPEMALTSLGVLAARARCIQALARAVVDGQLDLRATAPVPRTLEVLRSLPGIGEWTAQYIALRCLSWPDAFPHTDLVIKRAFPGMTPRQVLAASEQWRPWRAYATLHLWKAAAPPVDPITADPSSTSTSGVSHE
jgi:AraC family transcriptional regulator of adaptative response / DNA-3-methyladenine glycosylase II